MKCVYGGRAGVLYVITTFSLMDSLPNFLTHGAPLSAFRARERSTTISYYCFLAKAEEHWRNNEKLLSRWSDWVMFAKDKFILQLNLVGSSSSQTFFIIVFIKREFV